ncbi:unnamed protein product [Rotaria sordida]|uniref:Uncharacterized protein n=1 Tax=Rotaria sordida TaxID=392033 RepID=A0A814BNA7_9BILA|nr:unnamed protein product [Rotaria sordida]CAF3700418.1 unnamed protein product [Rotaria sordida]
MRLYALHKRQFVAVFVLFFICLFITILIGIAGPSVIIQSSYYKSEDQQKQISGPYKLEASNLDKFHQRLWLTMKTTTDSNGKKKTIYIYINGAPNVLSRCE